MPSKPIVSVIVPVYKVETYLRRCLDSIVGQSFADYELILVDDGSPDSCGTICDEYKNRDSRIQVIHQNNAGASTARNVGIDCACGEWITFVDPDDWLHRDYLTALVSGIKADADDVVCRCTITDSLRMQDKKYTEFLFSDRTLKDIYEDRYARTRVWGHLFRRNVIGDIRFIPGTEPMEDVCFNELLFREDMRFRVTDTELYYYYMRMDSAIHTRPGRDSLQAVDKLLDFIQNFDDGEKRRRIALRCFKSILSVRYSELFTTEYPKVEKECDRLLKRLSLYLPELTFKDRSVILLLSKFPGLYRIWRILNDCTLLRFEKEKKRKLHQLPVNKGHEKVDT